MLPFTGAFPYTVVQGWNGCNRAVAKLVDTHWHDSFGYFPDLIKPEEPFDHFEVELFIGLVDEDLLHFVDICPGLVESGLHCIGNVPECKLIYFTPVHFDIPDLWVRLIHIALSKVQEICLPFGIRSHAR